MKWVLAFHIIFMVAWFAGLFYLPRLFVYHTLSSDSPSIQRFKIMEHRLYYSIMYPAAILTTLFGIWLLSFNLPYYLQQTWMHTKLSMVIILWIYHIYCGKLLRDFKHDRKPFSALFYRWFNEIPTLLLMVIVILVVVKP